MENERMTTAADGIKLTIRNAKIINRNFAGRERKNQQGEVVNAKGKRNFCVVFSDEEAAALLEDGWNIRHKKDGTPFLPIEVSYNIPEYDPVIFYVDGGKRYDINEDTVDAIDDLDIAEAEVVIRPYHWHVRNQEGIKAYLTKLKLALMEDDFLIRHGVQEATSEEELPFN